MLGAAGAVAAVLGAFAAGSLASDAGLFSPAVLFCGAFLGRAAAAVVFVAVFFARVVFLGLASSSFCAKWGSEADAEDVKRGIGNTHEVALRVDAQCKVTIIVAAHCAVSRREVWRKNTQQKKKEKTQQKKKNPADAIDKCVNRKSNAALWYTTQKRYRGNGQPQMPERERLDPAKGQRERENGKPLVY